MPFGCILTFYTTFFLEITLERQNFHFLTFMFQSFNFPQNYNLLKSNRNLVQFQNLFALKIYQFYFITCIPTDFEHYGRYGLHQNTKTFHFALLNNNRRMRYFNIVYAPMRHNIQWVIFGQNLHERQGKIFGRQIF